VAILAITYGYPGLLTPTLSCCYNHRPEEAESTNYKITQQFQSPVLKSNHHEVEPRHQYEFLKVGCREIISCSKSYVKIRLSSPQCAISRLQSQKSIGLKICSARSITGI
jgi:hypothetical protein